MFVLQDFWADFYHQPISAQRGPTRTYPCKWISLRGAGYFICYLHLAASANSSAWCTTLTRTTVLSLTKLFLLLWLLFHGSSGRKKKSLFTEKEQRGAACVRVDVTTHHTNNLTAPLKNDPALTNWTAAYMTQKVNVKVLFFLHFYRN